MPPALVGVAFATITAAFFDLPIRYVDLPDSLTGAINFPGLASLGRIFEGPILAAVATLAVVASAAGACDPLLGGTDGALLFRSLLAAA